MQCKFKLTSFPIGMLLPSAVNRPIYVIQHNTKIQTLMHSAKETSMDCLGNGTSQKAESRYISLYNSALKTSSSRWWMILWILSPSEKNEGSSRDGCGPLLLPSVFSLSSFFFFWWQLQTWHFPKKDSRFRPECVWFMDDREGIKTPNSPL